MTTKKFATNASKKLTLTAMKDKVDYMQIDRTKGVLAALDYLGMGFDPIPVVGRTTHKFPKRRIDKIKSMIAAIKLRFS